MRVIGLTGGIGAGKSTVSDYLREKGYTVIDADRIAHEITEKGSPVLEQIRDVFGSCMFCPDGTLDRKRMASMVFSDDRAREKLEEITTKQVISISEERLQQYRLAGDRKVVFLDAPLLFETGADRLTDLVWLVTAELSVRVSRVMERDETDEASVLARISAQMDAGEKEARADEVIDNSKGKEELYQRVEGLLKEYAER
ncbi:MAG: dephospho-CoA kinase [Emergencia sp.]